MRLACLAQTLVAITIVTTFARVDGADDPPTEIEKARSAYEKAREKHQAELLKQFDEAAERITKQKVAAEERAKRVDAVKAEKGRFEKEGLIPWSESMRPHLAGYQKNLAVAEAPLKKAFDRDIDRALKAKNTAHVNRLRADLITALDVKVVATWSHGTEVPGSGHEIQLYSNGKIGGPDSGATWTFQNGILTLRWPNATAPGGAWVDSCSVSADGRTYSGKNQKGVRIGGYYVAK
ncbi:hypothetical protein [Frigoriglobus tundricola]|uniref:Uncharacterized protein n=1 Tax=Frigoriglobus tundricola TaxID=2774151 RepID=A0A6M5Z445_9BACT|nr:hypothetical protein [Frigoriglobus tundricola]QJX00244.1 hypothetical protein FTUN_7868 [Frigoriglobus tundricola]